MVELISKKLKDFTTKNFVINVKVIINRPNKIYEFKIYKIYKYTTEPLEIVYFKSKDYQTAKKELMKFIKRYTKLYPHLL